MPPSSIRSKTSDTASFAGYTAGVTATLNEKSRLRPFLEAWRGKRFTAEELKGFDPDVLLGVNATIQILHVTKNDKVYDNISTIMKAAKGAPLLKVSDYVRVVDRPKVPTNGTSAPATTPQRMAQSLDEIPEALDIDDDDLPF